MIPFPPRFTARLSVCALFPYAYRKVDEADQQNLRSIYSTLAGDETPMVRRAAALKLSDFCKVIGRQSTGNEIMSIYRQLAQDDTQDVVRVACVGYCYDVGSILLSSLLNCRIGFAFAIFMHLNFRHSQVITSLQLIQNFRENSEENKTHTLSVLTSSAEDRSWRVRLAVAQVYNH